MVALPMDIQGQGDRDLEYEHSHMHGIATVAAIAL